VKNFFRRLFFWDDPAAGAVFGSLLTLVWSFCSANWACVFPDLMDVLRGKPFAGMSGIHLNWMAFWLGILLLQLLVWLYTAFLELRFFFTLDRSRYKIGFAGVLLLAAGWLVVGEYYTGWIGWLVGVAAINILGFNALCIRKNNFYWYILMVAGLLALVPGIAILSNISQIFDCPGPGENPIPVAWRVPVVYFSLACGIGAFFCRLKLLAGAKQKRLRKVWNNGCWVLLGLLGVTYITITLGAIYQQYEVKKTFKALEENFKKPLNARELEKMYYEGRKVDEKFHSELRSLLDSLGRDDLDFSQIYGMFYLEKFPDEFRKEFFTDNAGKIGGFFDKPLPARQRNYVPGNLTFMMLQDLSYMRSAARFFCTQIRFACDEKDYNKMMQAWKRSGNITEYLRHDTSLIAALVLIAVEYLRLDALELMLNSNMLSDKDLLDIQKELQMSAGKLPALNRKSLYCEAVFGWDTAMGVVNGTLRGSNGEVFTEGFKHYRYASPGMWYLFACNGKTLLRFYKAENLCKVGDFKERSFAGILASMLVPVLGSAGERMHDIEMRYKTFNALIEAIKIKRSSGKYPEKLPLAIKDHFSGKMLQYKLGKFEVETNYLIKREKLAGNSNSDDDFFAEADDAKYEIKSRIKKAHGIIIWSIGRNRIDENGFKGRTDNKQGDDISARLVLP